MRAAAYEEIIKYMAKENFGIAELRQKIENLRCTYNQQVGKIKKSKKSSTGVNDAYVPNIKLFSLMDSFTKTVKCSGNILFCLLLSSSITSSTSFNKTSAACTKYFLTTARYFSLTYLFIIHTLNRSIFSKY
nr:unnamed protein product [Callosobruchus analis]